jgi:hypothetical protein
MSLRRGLNAGLDLGALTMDGDEVEMRLLIPK